MTDEEDIQLTPEPAENPTAARQAVDAHLWDRLHRRLDRIHKHAAQQAADNPTQFLPIVRWAALALELAEALEERTAST